MRRESRTSGDIAGVTIPASWLPTVELDEVAMAQACGHYKWPGSEANFDWVDTNSLRLVGTYLGHWESWVYWDVILAGSVRGYSMFLHEWSELQSYSTQETNPFDEESQINNYDPNHAKGLLAEHRFLQVVAGLMGHSFTLRELVCHNPHGDRPEGAFKGDWEVLAEQLPDRLSRADQELVASPAELDAFYRRLGFERAQEV